MNNQSLLEALRSSLEKVIDRGGNLHAEGGINNWHEFEVACNEAKKAFEHYHAQNSHPVSAAVDELETEAWLIEWDDKDGHHKRVFTHNAIADYRSIDPNAKVTELVRRRASAPSDQEKSTRILSDEDIEATIAEVYTKSFNSSPGRMRDAPKPSPLVFKFAHALLQKFGASEQDRIDAARLRYLIENHVSMTTDNDYGPPCPYLSIYANSHNAKGVDARTRILDAIDAARAAQEKS